MNLFYRISYFFKSIFLLCLITFSTLVSANIIRDAEIENFLEEISHPIFSEANLNLNSVDIYIFNDKSINAFVACGQKIFVNTGLIQSFETPSMLRGVMAHETGNIAGGHLARSDEALERAQTPMIVGLLLGIGAAIAGDGDAAQALLLGSQQIAQGMVAKYSRSQESAADQAAIKYLEGIKKSSNGMLEVLYKFANQEALSSNRQSVRVRSHPISRDRIRSLEQKVNKSQFINERDNEKILFQYKMIQAKLDGFLNNPNDVIRKAKKDSSLIFNKYSLAVAYYRKALLKESLSALNEMINQYPNNPWFYELKGQVLYESGKIRESIIPYRKSLSISPNEPLLMVALATALNALENKSNAIEAISLLKKSLMHDQKNTQTWFQLAISYSRINDIGNAELASAERHFLTGNVKMASFHAKKSLKYNKNSSISKLRAQDIVLDSENKAKWKRRCPV